MDKLFSYLEQYYRLTEIEKQLIIKNCNLLQIEKGKHFLEAGIRCHQIGFVAKGILRTYHYDSEGKDITNYFISKGQFATNLKSYNEDMVSDTSIMAEVDSELVVITKEKMVNLSNQITNWDKIVSSILESKLLEKVKYKTEMINQDATTRYLDFLKTHENLVNNVPLSHIASYLGITQYSLSRIRKNLLHSNFLPNGKKQP